MRQSNLIRGEWTMFADQGPFPRGVARLVEALRLLRLRVDAAHHYAAARGPSASGIRGRGARLVPSPALKWHQQMRRLDNLMLAPRRGLAARLAWRVARAWAHRRDGSQRCATT